MDWPGNMSPLTMVLIFSGSEGSSITKGPYPQVRLEGELMRSVQDGPIIARHVNHVWKVDGRDHTRCDCAKAVWVHFERVDGTKSKAYGPLEHLSFMDGVAFIRSEGLRVCGPRRGGLVLP